MEKFLICIKHRIKLLWKLIEWVNSLFFFLAFNRKLEKVLPAVHSECSRAPYIYKKLVLSDAKALHELLASQPKYDLEYFSPHEFTEDAIRRQFSNRAFLLMGVFEKDKMLGYYFLRFFANKKCFVGRLIDKDYRGKGIGIVMNNIMYETAWRMGFRCLSTISNNNKLVIRAHTKNPSMVILKELKNDYLLVEFVKQRPLRTD